MTSLNPTYLKQLRHGEPTVTLIIIAAFVLLCTLAVIPLHADEIADNRQNLQRVKKQISDTANKLQEKKTAEDTLLGQLENLEKQISSSDTALKNASKALKNARENIQILEGKIDRYEAILKRSQRDVEKRLRTLYTSGDISSLRLIFSTDTPLDLAENLDFLSRIATHDKELLFSYRQRTRQLQKTRLDLHNELTLQKQTLQQRRDRKRQLARDTQQKKQLVGRIRRDKSSLNKRLKKLEERSKNLAALVKTLKERKTAAYIPTSQGFDTAKGSIPWPSSGVVRAEFGTHRDRNFGTSYKSNGLEIVAVPLTPIKAIWPGKIVFSAPFKGYGNLIIIDHGKQYYSLYAQIAHLKHAVGDIVKQGETISTSGYEGRDSYTLEIRHRGTPVNPRDWLKPRKH
ncbi:MAG: peptidoglycan DD-metalloendopeptidase family protein [Desulfuromonas sp.]|nr:peptidoglycan DD-metalloendopeptidase family protein [Desulfuromonas sp.]